MERILAALERRFGRFTIEGLTFFLVVGQTMALFLAWAKPEVLSFLTLDANAIRHGQVWRLFSYVFVPPSFQPLGFLLAAYFLYLMGTALESHWGPFRYQLFWFLGIGLTTAAALLFGGDATSTFLVSSLFLAFATLFPDYELLLFFIIPVKVKWLALLDGLYLAMQLATLPGGDKLVVLAAVSNYFLFFGGHLLGTLRNERRFAGRASERHRFHREVKTPSGVPPVRKCALCGITSKDDPSLEFRICTCEKHGGKATEFCLPHARNH